MTFPLSTVDASQTAHLLDLFARYGYAALLPLSLTTGPLVAMFAGVMVSLGSWNWLVAFVLLMLADITGDALYYALGRLGRTGIASRWWSYLHLSEEKLAPFERKFHEHDWKLLFFGKTQIIGLVVLAAAGVAKMPFGKYIWYNILGSVPKIVLFEWFGFYAGNVAVSKGAAFFDIFALGSLAFLVIAVLFFGSRWKRMFAEKELSS